MSPTPAITSFTKSFRFLSNFYPSSIPYEGITYDSVEAAYQAAKTLIPRERERIAKCETAAIAKRKGRHVTLRPGWDDIKLVIMLDLLRIKFTSSFTLRSALLSTGNAELVHTVWWYDPFWGVVEGVGENHLGQLLMQVRSELKLELTEVVKRCE